MLEITLPAILDKFKKKYKKPKKWKDPAGHDFIFNVTGHYESCAVYCEVCDKVFQLTKKEIEGLMDV